MIAGIRTVIPMMDVIATTCTAVILMTTIELGLVPMVPKYSTCAMVVKIILSTLASMSKHWCLEYLVQEILSQKYAIASGGDCKI